MPSYRWTNNAVAGAAGYPYPSVTWMPTVAEFRAQFKPDYTLVSTSTFRGQGTDGLDLGFDWVFTGVAMPGAPGSVQIIPGP
jgi:hypothetical protein